MKRLWLSGIAAMACAATSVAAIRTFVQVQGDQLMEHGRPFRFISFNIPNLHLVEDNMVFESANAWRWPDAFEIRDALSSIQQQGGLVVRTYVLSVVRTNDPPGLPRHVLGPGQFDEQGFRVLDEVVRTAHQTGVRLIIPLVDNWSWWGGIAEYAGFRGRPKEAFWTDPQIILDFKRTIHHLVTRTNTLTGLRYADDPAILCWETGNELQSPVAWTQDIAAYIKSLDRRHPVMDGYHTTELRPESLAMPDIDIVTTHHYPGGRKSFAQLVRENASKSKGRKPYVVGEFGFVPTAQMAETLQAVQETGTAGALAWSLRFRNRDGGFYWHSEPAGGDKYKAFHWPGFPTGADYDEAGWMAFMQQQAFAIRNLPLPPSKAPPAPRLLPIRDAAAVSWQGSVGAHTYAIERAPRRSGPWTRIATGVDETAVQYRPLFSDTTAGTGTYFYRVRAVNGAGASRPSNVVGPVTVEGRVLVDEMTDLTRMHAHRGAVELATREPRKAKEDMHRLAGKAGTQLVYQLAEPVQSVRIFAFFPGDSVPKFAPFSVSAGVNATAFTVAMPGTYQAFSDDAGDYGYWQPVLSEFRDAPPHTYWIQIVYGAEAQISRVEIRYGDRAR